MNGELNQEGTSSGETQWSYERKSDGPQGVAKEEPIGFEASREAVKRACLLRSPSEREDTVIVTTKGKTTAFQFTIREKSRGGSQDPVRIDESPSPNRRRVASHSPVGVHEQCRVNRVTTHPPCRRLHIERLASSERYREKRQVAAAIGQVGLHSRTWWRTGWQASGRPSGPRPSSEVSDSAAGPAPAPTSKGDGRKESEVHHLDPNPESRPRDAACRWSREQ